MRSHFQLDAQRQGVKAEQAWRDEQQSATIISVMGVSEMYNSVVLCGVKEFLAAVGCVPG